MFDRLQKRGVKDILIQAQKGDLLFYTFEHIWMHPIASVITLGEYLDGSKSDNGVWYYHNAIALGDNRKIEANGGELIGEYDIEPNEPFHILRPKNVTDEQIVSALTYVKQFEGEQYGWLLIANDAIRALTDNKLSLPDNVLNYEQNHTKVCSTFGILYALHLGLIGSETEQQIEVTTPMSLFDLIVDKCEYVNAE